MRIILSLLLIWLATAAAEWKCGARPEDSAVTEKTIGLLCPGRRLKINRCCIDHDACYRRKIGQRPCDDEFERCVMESSKYTLCKPVMKLFVGLVRTFGIISYKGMW
ncbi:hypothetical protein PMAYCL1PPCAC_00824 [Pristionchus mayeri]|uniref:Uncharacterized protein n=1 Tax=Pristionchus mayeri TaxID=1317129 RepID=A0AAN4YZF5_9BILA|nr:hypothetical protein PMAYCL1PPCAC_00824 [Pristionchus mayeri]